MVSFGSPISYQGGLMKIASIFNRIKHRIFRSNEMETVEKPIVSSDEDAFVYSQEWYDQAYHIGRVGVDRRTFKDVRDQYEAAGYHDRLNRVLDRVHVPDQPVKWLEVGCHLGLTACWIAERFPLTQLFMFDFSISSINWCKNWFPYPQRATIWQGNVENICLPNNSLDNFFDFATCIDVTEHLPDVIYQKLIMELLRVLKKGGSLILMQGNTPNVEHIHVLTEERLVSDFTNAGLKLVKKLPDRHYLFRK